MSAATTLKGFRRQTGVAVFANAAVMVPEAEWAFGMDDARMSAAPEAMQGVFQGVRRVSGPIQDEVERITVGGDHVPFPAVGHIAPNGAIDAYVPTVWRAV